MHSCLILYKKNSEDLGSLLWECAELKKMAI
jgi:hypothetical protein